MSIDIQNIVKLWYETQYGHHLKCRAAQIEFSNRMQELYDELIDEEPMQQQCIGDNVI